MKDFDQDADGILTIAMDIGERLLKSGGEVGRVEDTIRRILEAYGAQKIQVLTITSSIVVTAFDRREAPHTQTRRISGGLGTDLEKFIRLNDLSRKICAMKPDLQEVRREIGQIDGILPYSLGSQYLIWACVSGVFTLFLGGSIRDALAASLIGVVLKYLTDSLQNLQINPLVRLAIVSMIGGLGASAAVRLGWADSVYHISVGNVMPLIPGVALTNAIRDMFSGDTISGLLRFAEALIFSIVIAWGFALGASWA